MTPTTLRTIAALLTAVAVLLNGYASGHLDPAAIADAALAFGAVFALVQAAVKSHAIAPATESHAPAPTTGAHDQAGG